MSTLPTRAFGRTGLQVSILGLGGGTLGSEALEDRDAGRLLHVAFELGITLFDTARSYGLSEDRIGRHLADRRSRVVVSTKLGYGIEGLADWTGPCVEAGVDEALARLRTDVLDIVHLHSCPVEVLERGEVVDALEGAVRSGKIRVPAYSGDNEALAWAVASGRFGSIQTSVNVCDQWSSRNVLPRAAAERVGVIAKRPLANAFWRFEERPTGDYAETYWHRWHTMAPDLEGVDPSELALRFAAHAPGVTAAITGTVQESHLRRNVDCVLRGPVDDEVARRIVGAFDRHGADWPGDV
jgi:aryl-alcohol dehydrogenase-like predicted oxidoreductase